MKHWYFILLMGLISSCDLEESGWLSSTTLLKSGFVNYRLKSGPGYLLLLKEQSTPDDTIYFFQGLVQDGIQRTLEVRKIWHSDSGLAIELNDASMLKMDLYGTTEADFQGYGLSILSGRYYFNKFFDDDGPLNDPDVSSISCKCVSNANTEKCDSGGKGSDSCETKAAANAPGAEVGGRCSVKCASGYYACCRTI